MTTYHKCVDCYVTPVYTNGATCPACQQTALIRQQIKANETHVRDERYRREEEARATARAIERANNPTPYVPWRGWPDFILRVIVISPGVFLVGYFWYWLVCG